MDMGMGIARASAMTKSIDTAGAICIAGDMGIARGRAQGYVQGPGQRPGTHDTLNQFFNSNLFLIPPGFGIVIGF